MKSGKAFLCSTIFAVASVFTPQLTGSAAGAEAFQVNVAGLKANDVVPARFVYNHAGCSGENVSPEISGSGVPASAKSLAIVVWDQDAPVSGGFYHWVIVNLPVETKKLSEGAGNIANHKAPNGSIQLFNDWGEAGYGGPCPPPGNPHRYYFKLYALDAKLALKPGATKVELEGAMKSHILGQAELMGQYGR